MKKVRIKLALLVGVSFVVTFSIVLGIFNWLMLHQIKSNADISIQYLLLGNEDKIPRQTLYMADIVWLDADYVVVSKFESTEEQERIDNGIALWCSAHPGFDRLQRASASGRDYYLSMMETTDYDGSYEITVLYVDVTGEMALIRSINIAILFVMLFMGIGVSALGYFTGVQIERSQAAQKTFFENTSHELKTPLTSIRGFAEGLITGVMGDHELAAKIILGETKKMTLLIDDILTTARLESGAVKLQLESVDLREMIEDCLLPLEGAIRKRGLHIELDIQEGQVSADPNQLEHALNNVLTNAIKYADSMIVLKYDGENLSILNDGCQLSDEDLRHIFDRFYIGKTGNTGIGLALTKEIAELHGWKLRAEKYHHGIGFIFTIPSK